MRCGAAISWWRSSSSRKSHSGYECYGEDGKEKNSGHKAIFQHLGSHGGLMQVLSVRSPEATTEGSLSTCSKHQQCQNHNRGHKSTWEKLY